MGGQGGRRRRVNGSTVVIGPLAVAAALCSTVRLFALAPSAIPALRQSTANSAAGAAGIRRHLALAAAIGKPASVASGSHQLAPLPYTYDALEPWVDKETVTFHHDSHHNTYVQNLNKALEGSPPSPLVGLQPGAITGGNLALRRSAGGAYNHELLWRSMAPPTSAGRPSAKLAGALDAVFGSEEAFKAAFEAEAAPGSRFGSGWVWLVVKPDGSLAITSTLNQDNPLMDGADCVQGIPILPCDVWEHAYYLRYQYRRPEYVKSWWNVVNWAQVSAWYEDALDGVAPDV